MNKLNYIKWRWKSNSLAFKTGCREKCNKKCYFIILVAVMLLVSFNAVAIITPSYHSDHDAALSACNAKAEEFKPLKIFGNLTPSCVQEKNYDSGYAGYDFCVIYNVANSGEDHIVQCNGADELFVFKYRIPYKRTDITKYYASMEDAMVACTQDLSAARGYLSSCSSYSPSVINGFRAVWSEYVIHLHSQQTPSPMTSYTCDAIETEHDHLLLCNQYDYYALLSGCPENQRSDTTGLCVPENSILKNAGNACEKLLIGNPINIAIGNKYQKDTDYRASGRFPITVSRTYNSITKSWRLFSEIRKISAASSVDVIRADGKVFRFINENNVWLSDPDITGTLTVTEEGQDNITGWTYTTHNDQVETYDAQGRILSATKRSGLSHTYSYQADSITVTHTNGDTLVYQLDSEGRVIGFTDLDNRNYEYTYDAEGRLLSITYPDDTPADTTDNPQRIYHYEDNNFSHALTGITDENGNRYATWTYDSEGRAISSEHASGVDRTTLTYNADGTTTVTNPLGKQTTYHFTTIHGVRKVTQVEGHPTTSCEGANKSYSYDANGNIASKTDWNGVTTTYTYDMARNLELTRTEAVGTPQERTITTEWHPQFRLPTKIAEPNKITEYTYDAQGRQLSSSVQSVQ